MFPGAVPFLNFTDNECRIRHFKPNYSFLEIVWGLNKPKTVSTEHGLYLGWCLVRAVHLYETGSSQKKVQSEIKNEIIHRSNRIIRCIGLILCLYSVVETLLKKSPLYSSDITATQLHLVFFRTRAYLKNAPFFSLLLFSFIPKILEAIQWTNHNKLTLQRLSEIVLFVVEEARVEKLQDF